MQNCPFTPKLATRIEENGSNGVQINSQRQLMRQRDQNRATFSTLALQLCAKAGRLLICGRGADTRINVDDAGRRPRGETLHRHIDGDDHNGDAREHDDLGEGSAHGPCPSH